MRYPDHSNSNYVGLDARTELARILEPPDSNGAVVSGPIGSAKSALLEAVLGVGLHEAIRLLCSPVLGKSNFGALSPLLVDFGETPNEVSVLRHLSHWFAVREGNRKPYVVVEEAHYLDLASAFVLTQLVQAGRIKLILLAVGSGNLEPVVASTELGARLGRVTLGPLSVREVAAYSHTQLGRRATEATNAVVTKMCAGNPLLIRAFLGAARSQEILVESNDWFVLTQARLENDAHLSGVVSEIQKRLDISDAKALEILALGGAEDVANLERVSGADTGRLIDTGLVEYCGDSRVKITAPIYAQVLRDIVPPGLSVQLWREVSDKGRKYGTLPASLLWACESGEIVETERFVEAVAIANNELDFHSAWRLCLQAGNFDTEPRLALQAARALLGMRRHQKVASTVERASSQTTDLEIFSNLKSLETAAIWRSGGSKAEIHGLLQRWKQRTEQLQAQEQPPGEHETDRNLKFMEISELWIDLVERRNMRTIPARVQRCQETCQRGSFEYLMCGDLMGKTLMSLGYFTEAAEMAAESFRAIAAGVEDEFAMTYQVLATYMQTLFAVGDYAKIRAVKEGHTPQSPEMYLAHSGMLNFWAAFALIQEGRWSAATAVLDEARAELAAHDPERLYALAESLVQYSNSRLGTTMLREATAVSKGPAGHGLAEVENRHSALLASAYVFVAGNPQNLDYLVTLAGRAHVEQRSETEQQLLILLWQHAGGNQDYRDSFERLTELCGQGRGRNSNALADAVLLNVDAESAEVIEAAEMLYLGGETGLGTELLASVLDTTNGPQNERQRGVLLRKLSEWINDLGGMSWGNLAVAISERALTGREKEIIDLVGSGLSNKEIARALTVSQRTVEGHLYRVFAKLGISGRDELNGQH